MVRTLDKTHTVLSYIEGSLKNVTIVSGQNKHLGLIFSLLNPPVPLGGNIVSLDIYVDEIPIAKKSIFVATSDDVVNASSISENRPISFRPYQSARFLITREEMLDRTRKHKIVILSKLEGFEQIIIPFTFSDHVGDQRERIFIPSNLFDETNFATDSEDTIFKNFMSPLILSGKKAYIVCSSNANVSANWTWMGARYDNGGLYVPPVRAFGRINVEISSEVEVRKRLPNFVASSRHENGVLYTRHEVSGLQVRRTLFVPLSNRGFVMRLEISDKTLDFKKLGLRRKIGRSRRKIRIHFLIDGNITSYGLAAISQHNSSELIEGEYCLLLQTAARRDIAHYFGTIGVYPKTLKPSKVLTDSFDNDLEISYDLEIEPGENVELALVATGSYISAQDCVKEYKYLRDNYQRLLQDTEMHFRGLSSSLLHIQSTQHQNSTFLKLIKAYEKARMSMEYLKADYDELGPGICAGLPRFPNYWARDTGWSLRGYLSLGDYDFVLEVIENFFRHQARRTTRAATRGELPMIISGKAFLHNTTFGSADSTFLFPWIIREYVYSTGNVKYLRNRWRNIIDLVNWGFSKDLDDDGLIEHGFSGIAEKLPIQDSTWMDHIDRRKSANDVQALFYESLKIGTELAIIVGDSGNEKKWSNHAKLLQDRIDRVYWNEKTGFYYDTIRRDGSKDSSIRPNALIPILTGAVSEKTKAESVLRRIEKSDLTTPWGVRTLSSLDPKYHPTLYHDGAVWPLVTGWAAISEIKYGRREQALYYIESMAERILSENGMFAETYRGDRPEPFNSCILQAWSVGMFIYALREMMLGMQIDITKNRIQFEPQIPESLKNNSAPITFEHTLIGADGKCRLYMILDPFRDKLSLSFKGNKPKNIQLQSSTHSIEVED
ncbi:MAG: amylo-alpha-1,6-glucosidase [Nitrososphaeraceae archaeon]